MNGRKIYWPRGRTLGGSSSINGLIYVRGQRDDYDRWAAAGNAGWSYDEVLPYFSELEHNVGGDPAYHGRDGPLWARRSARRHELIEAVIAGAGELGIAAQRRFQRRGAGRRRLLPVCRPAADGAARPPSPTSSRRGGGRTSASRPARRRRGSRSTGAAPAASAIARRGAEHTARARREVLLCAGALQSPQLLQLSGVGPAGASAAASAFPSCTRSPASAKTCRTICRRASSSECTTPITTNDDLASFVAHDRHGHRLSVHARRTDGRRHQPGRHIRARAARTQRRPDVQFHFATLSSDMAGSPTHTFSGFTMSVCQLAAAIARLGAHPLGRSAGRARDAAELPVDTSRPRDADCRHPACAPACGDRRALAVRQARIPAGAGGRVRRRSAGIRPEHRRDDLPSQRHLQDGRRRAIR